MEQGCKDPYLHIKRETIEQACRELKTPAAISVYLYLSSNKDGFTLGFSPKAISEAYGISEDSARNGFNKLIEKGFIIQNGKSHFIFSNTPKSKIKPKVMKKKSFTDDETGQIYLFSYQELLEAVGDVNEANKLWNEAQED